MATEELGAAAYRKFDIEAWMPSRKGYGEVSSASNCTNYQSKRLNISYFDKGTERKLVHTINATALAVPRIIMSILENNWDEKGQKVDIPEVIHPYLSFKEIKQKRKNLIFESN